MEKNYNSYEYFPYDTEVGLLGSWVNGKHLEDIELFDRDIFDLKKIFEAVKNGDSLVEIYADSTLKEERDRLMVNYDPVMSNYFACKGEALDFQLQMYANRLKEATVEDKQKYIDKITETNNAIHIKEDTPQTVNYADVFLKELEETLAEDNAQYGLKELDKYTKGIHRGQLIVFGARPGQGKTTIAVQIASQVAEQGYKVIYLPLEMRDTEILEKLIRQSQILFDNEKLKNPGEEEKESIRDYLDKLEKEGNLKIYYNMFRLPAIEKMIKKEEPYLVIVDQLTQCRPARKTKDTREQFSEVTAQLKRMALEYNVSILALSQINRDSENHSRPTMENLIESDSTGQNADVIVLFKKDDSNLATFYLEKNRRGEQHKEFCFKFDGVNSTFFPVILNDSVNRMIEEEDKGRLAKNDKRRAEYKKAVKEMKAKGIPITEKSIANYLKISRNKVGIEIEQLFKGQIENI